MSLTAPILKPFQRGLVVGKFSPLHRGHELLIRRAFQMCHKVVIISYSKPEFPRCEAQERHRWFGVLFPRAHWMVVTDQWLRERSLIFGDFVTVPPNDADELTHRRFVGMLLRAQGLTVDSVFSSEDYGDGFARDLTAYFREYDLLAPEITHILVDRERKEAPISGSQIRANIEAHIQWVSRHVYGSFVKRICILGGESCGKSTLAKALAAHFGTVHVEEYGREYWESVNGYLKYEDMLHIAVVQVASEDRTCHKADRFLFCDTSPLTTLFYSQYLFGRANPELERLAERHYELAVLCAADFEFVQDGTRQDAKFRERQNAWYIKELRERGMRFVEAKGSLNERIAHVSECLKRLI